MSAEQPEAGGCSRRGRPRLRRTIAGNSDCRCYKPSCREQAGQGVSLTPDDIELLRLIDLEGL